MLSIPRHNYKRLSVFDQEVGIDLFRTQVGPVVADVPGYESEAICLESANLIRREPIRSVHGLNQGIVAKLSIVVVSAKEAHVTR
jgi:hypothetical protein